MAQRLQFSEKLQGAGVVSLPEGLQYKASKAAGEDFDRQEEFTFDSWEEYLENQQRLESNVAMYEG